MRNMLTQANVAATNQRLDIAEILFAAPQHLSAEQIIEQLTTSAKKVSKATVYNTLNMFVKQGLLREVYVDPERRFYDSTTTPHYHFYNLETRELTDIPLDHVVLSHMPALPEGTRADGIDIVIKVRPT